MWMYFGQEFDSPHLHQLALSEVTAFAVAFLFVSGAQGSEDALYGEELEDEAADEEIRQQVGRVEDEGVPEGIHARRSVRGKEDDAGENVAEEAGGESERGRKDAVAGQGGCETHAHVGQGGSRRAPARDARRRDPAAG